MPCLPPMFYLQLNLFLFFPWKPHFSSFYLSTTEENIFLCIYPLPSPNNKKYFIGESSLPMHLLFYFTCNKEYCFMWKLLTISPGTPPCILYFNALPFNMKAFVHFMLRLLKIFTGISLFNSQHKSFSIKIYWTTLIFSPHALITFHLTLHFHHCLLKIKAPNFIRHI